MPGFGFVDFQIDTHFDQRGRLARLIPAMSDIGTPIGVGIDEFTCLYYKDGTGYVFGTKGVFVADISTATKTKSPYFSMKSVRVNYLTQGDSFDFKNKKITTTKTPITSYQYSGFLDSNNIISAY